MKKIKTHPLIGDIILELVLYLVVPVGILFEFSGFLNFTEKYKLHFNVGRDGAPGFLRRVWLFIFGVFFVFLGFFYTKIILSFATKIDDFLMPAVCALMLWVLLSVVILNNILGSMMPATFFQKRDGERIEIFRKYLYFAYLIIVPLTAFALYYFSEPYSLARALIIFALVFFVIAFSMIKLHSKRNRKLYEPFSLFSNKEDKLNRHN